MVDTASTTSDTPDRRPVPPEPDQRPSQPDPDQQAAPAEPEQTAPQQNADEPSLDPPQDEQRASQTEPNPGADPPAVEQQAAQQQQQEASSSADVSQGDAPPNVLPFPDRGRPQVATTIADFKIGNIDGCGRTIDDIYFKRTSYVIYCTRGTQEEQVLVQYSQDSNVATQQIAGVADIIPLRNQLQSLLPDIKSNKRRYYRQIAEAFRLGLENKLDVAKTTLENTIKEVENIRAAEGRNIYIAKAFPYAIGAGAVLLVVAAIFLAIGGASFGKAMSALAHLSMAAGAGSVGALLSIAISVRTRTVATDGDDRSIAIDALIRVLIGIISAAVLYLILATGVLSQLKIGDLTFSPGAIVWQLALLTGFAAGFLERLVPNLLEKKP